MFDDRDQFIRNIGSNGYNNGQFDEPRGVAFDDDDHLYITDHHRVQKFTASGDYMLQFGRYGSDDGELKYPYGLTVHNDKVYVANTDNNCISVYLTDGTFHQTIRGGSDPCEIVITSVNELLVVNSRHNCAYKLTLDGDCINKFYSSGDGMCDSSSIITDSSGFIFVADSGKDRVIVFDKHGTRIHMFGSAGSDEGQFLYPCAIAVNKNGDIYVSNHHNKRIQIFSNY